MTAAPQTAVRRAEVLSLLSLASDAGMGHPSDLGLRSAVVSVGLARLCSAPLETVREVFHLSLLRFSGCTAEAHLAAKAFGDEVKARSWLGTSDFSSPSSVMANVFKHLGKGEGALTRARMIARAFSRMSGLYEGAVAHCEVAQQVARALGLEEALTAPLGQVFESWNGKGIPKKLSGTAISLSVRIVTLVHDFELFRSDGGLEVAVAMARERSGGAHEPRLVELLADNAAALTGPLERGSSWDAALAAEPLPHGRLEGDGLDRALRSVAWFADLKSRFTRGHSEAVATLAGRAAEALGLEDVVSVQRAGLLHDVGRSGVTVSIWDKPGPLTENEREQVRVHAYLTERILARASGLAVPAAIASAVHERLDGKGYHRSTAAPMLNRQARVLAAADVYQALISPRAQRAALSADAAAQELLREVKAGRLCPDAVTAVLGAAGHATKAPGHAFPAGLSDREVEVLGLIASGLTNKEVAGRLEISPKTVGNHIQHIYEKIGVSTRAAAAVFAMEHHLTQ